MSCICLPATMQFPGNAREEDSRTGLLFPLRRRAQRSLASGGGSTLNRCPWIGLLQNRPRQALAHHRKWIHLCLPGRSSRNLPCTWAPIGRAVPRRAALFCGRQWLPTGGVTVAFRVSLQETVLVRYWLTTHSGSRCPSGQFARNCSYM